MKRYVRVTKKVLACLTLAGLLLSAGGCSGGEKPAEEAMAESAAESAAMAVKTQMPQSGNLTQATDYMGTVEPDKLIQVKPKMSGTVQTVNVSVGDKVSKGDLLMTFDTTDVAVGLSAQKAQIEVARAAVMSAQAQVDQSLGSTFDVQLANLESGVQQAKNGYASARQGLRDYNDSNSSPSDQIQAQRDKARESVALLETALDAAKRNRDKIIDDHQTAADGGDAAAQLLIDNAKEKVSSTEGSLRQAEDQLSLLNANYNDDDTDTQLRSLRTGVRNAQLAYDSANTIYELTKNDVRNDALKVANASLGQAAASFDAAVKGYEAQAHQLSFAQVTSPIDGIVEACSATEDTMAGTGDVLFTISNKSKLVVTFYVSEDAALQFALGDKVKIESGRNTYDGSIAEIGTMVDSTGLFKVKANVDNGELSSGVAVKVTVTTGKAQGLLIPQSAIYYDNGQAYVYSVKDGKAYRTDITVGISNNDSAQVMTGLDASSQVIVTWNPNLRDGVEVSATPMDAAASSSSAAEPSSAASSAAESSSAASSEAESSSVASSATESSSTASSDIDAGEAAKE